MRKIALNVLVGSHNYNLDDESSDRDYKTFVYPNFEDLYEGKFYTKSEIGEFEDREWHDIRKLPMLISKANINYIEVMFSVKHDFGSDFSRPWIPAWYQWMIENREALATANLKTFYNACWGTHLNKMGMLLKGTAGTKKLVEAYGYDTKQAMHAMRAMLSLYRFKQTGSMQETLWFKEGCGDQRLLFDIKHGKYTLAEFEDIVKYKSIQMHNQHEGWYGSQPKNDSPKELARLIKDEIRRQL